ncbi:MAG: cyclase family protein [Acidimicrobiales bacterium]
MTGVPGGAAMSRAEFDALFDELTDWSRAFERPPGTLGARVAESALAGARLVREGEVVLLAHPLDTAAGPDNTKPALFYMSDVGDSAAQEPRCHMDFVGVDYHGKSVTHLDAPAHMGFRDLLYGGVPADEAITSKGARHASVDALGAVVRHAVLLDVPASKGLGWLEPGTAISGDDLLEAAHWASAVVEPGAILFVRTGHGARREALGAWDPSDLSAGLHPSAMRTVTAWEPAVLGSDGDSDVRPSPVPGVHSPVHALALIAQGMPLLDNVALEQLSTTCRRLERYSFLCTVAPLVVPGGTGSPVTPLAVF